MKEGDVVIVPMPQADGVVKNRPAIVLREMPPFGDVLVCGVSTQLRQITKGFDELISQSDADFSASSLKDESLTAHCAISGSSHRPRQKTIPHKFCSRRKDRSPATTSSNSAIG